MYPLLETINSPDDLRKLERAQLPQLTDELRAFLIESVSKTGGHLSSNLGTVELTVALALHLQHAGRPAGMGCRSPDLCAQDTDRAPRGDERPAHGARHLRFSQAQ